MFLYDVALGLLRRGHLPVAYSTTLGEVAEELQKKTIPVISDLHALREPPDVIHAQHHLEAMTAMLHFPQTPVVYYCHGWLPWQEQPVVFPTIAKYVAVDDLCRERLLTTPGITPTQIETLYNFVDLSRFQPRPLLPKKPKSALIFSNIASDENYAGTIRAACQSAGIERVDLAGQGSGNVQVQPETLLPAYDVVFAKARCALEAMAVGCAVVVTECYGVGGLVTSENVEELRRYNFGVRTMQAAPLTEASIVKALSGYHPSDAAAVSSWIRAEVDLEKYLDELVTLYLEADRNARGTPVAPELKLNAAAEYLRSLIPLIKDQGQNEQRAIRAEQQVQELQTALNNTAREYADFRNSKSGRLILKLQRLKQRLTGQRK